MCYCWFHVRDSNNLLDTALVVIEKRSETLEGNFVDLKMTVIARCFDAQRHAQWPTDDGAVRRNVVHLLSF